MRTFIKRHQIALFFLLTFLLSWFPWYAGIAAETFTAGPSLAAIILVIIIGGKTGLKDLFRPFLRWRAGVSLWLIAIFGTAVMYIAGIGVHLLLGGDMPPFIMLREELRLVPLYLVLVVLMPWNGPLGEEFGWRGFALPRLQVRFGALTASIIIGVVWGVWHLPTFFAEQGVLAALVSSTGVVLFLVIYTAGTIANSVFITWLYNKSASSALIGGIIWHAMTNFWAPIILSDSSLIAAREGTHLPTIPATLYFSALAVQVVLAIVLILATRGKLGCNDKAAMAGQAR